MRCENCRAGAIQSARDESEFLRGKLVGRLVKFFAITYGVTWTCFISVAVLPIPAPYRGLLVLLGAFAPSLAALSLTARHEGHTGVRTLLRRVVQWRVPAPRGFFFP